MPDIPNDVFLATVDELTRHQYMCKADLSSWTYYTVNEDGKRFLAINTHEHVSPTKHQMGEPLNDIITEETQS